MVVGGLVFLVGALGFLLLRSGWRVMGAVQAAANPLPMCQRCRKFGPTRYVVFHQNIGVILALFHKQVEGCVCRSCVHGLFWSYTTTSLLLGWWGVKSLLINPFLILNNFVYYAWGILGRPVRLHPELRTE